MEEREDLYPNSVYKHFKGGLYTVVAAGTDCDDLKHKVVYQSNDTNKLWIRDYDEFMGFVEVDGKLVRRFEFLGVINLEQFLFEPK